MPRADVAAAPYCAASAGVAPLIGLILLLGQRGTVFAGQTLTASYSWLPEIGINLQPAPGRPRFPLRPADPRHRPAGDLRPLLPLRTGADGSVSSLCCCSWAPMLGVVLAENLLLMMLSGS
ncbi:hypothetical protein ACPA9J_12220 [Pseudomonas aeruginosa]